ncbi:hypothetical protein [Moorena producens]|uniref:hypothetical protein n=1 Tax=Moorena producens TaxID=1155739 RepID=UPI001314F062|nr:hypothetical protein [Moorena producens]
MINSCLLPLASCLSFREYVHLLNKNAILLSPSPHLPISPSPHLPISPTPYSLLPTPSSLFPNDNQDWAISVQQEYP